MIALSSPPSTTAASPAWRLLAPVAMPRCERTAHETYTSLLHRIEICILQRPAKPRGLRPRRVGNRAPVRTDGTAVRFTTPWNKESEMNMGCWSRQLGPVVLAVGVAPRGTAAGEAVVEDGEGRPPSAPRTLSSTGRKP